MNKMYISKTGPPGNKNGPHARGMPGEMEERRRKTEDGSWKSEAGPKTRCRDGTGSHVRDGTMIVRIRDGTVMNIRDGTFLREKIPKLPDLKRTGEGETYTVNNRKTGLNGGDMNRYSAKLCVYLAISAVKKRFKRKEHRVGAKNA